MSSPHPLYVEIRCSALIARRTVAVLVGWERSSALAVTLRAGDALRVCLAANLGFTRSAPIMQYGTVLVCSRTANKKTRANKTNVKRRERA